MQVIRGLHNLRAEHRGCVATIGNFDGVHLGHQAVFRHLRERAAAFGLPTTVVTFEPQPQEFFTPDGAPARLTRMREKLQALKDAGIDRVVLLEFGHKLAAMSAAQFVQELLVDGLDVKFLYVGDDFRFGRQRVGDIDLLRQAGEQHGFEVANMNTLMDGEARISSTRIRQALAQGDLDLAERNLGRPYRICGRVAHGDARGRTIGFPTANIDLHRKVSPVHGVFAVMLYGLAEGPLPGVANIGNRPTVTGDSRYLLEVHLFNFSRFIYGEHVQVEFRKWLRDERRFESFDALRQQIAQDAEQARNYFSID
ncbi:bifunctional riboflavin kinase/FAD synthetase [Sedimenticola thiotaurini]|uniref:Riboflavin biosynthesis protein n=1 Tax=Sedimenticola thiotaurini TaxID=1543721 RepID=A0A0F7K3A5_9GAMM|nr:bifunctional riboflavin kinase/FAD synthetase [Sedimenticola thiotaurini]AKH21418.1 FMN adenylyltransferase [Sedimenticola thiotaurini]